MASEEKLRACGITEKETFMNYNLEECVKKIIEYIIEYILEVRG